MGAGTVMQSERRSVCRAVASQAARRLDPVEKLETVLVVAGEEDDSTNSAASRDCLETRAFSALDPAEGAHVCFLQVGLTDAFLDFYFLFFYFLESLGLSA